VIIVTSSFFYFMTVATLDLVLTLTLRRLGLSIVQTE
jgi:hypothetical protein